MPDIHPSAVIHPDATIGDGCAIGPYCVIGGNVTLGAGNRLHSHVVIDGQTEVGSDNDFFPFASIGLKTQDLKWKGGTTWTRIGDRNTFRENVTVHSGTGDGEATVPRGGALRSLGPRGNRPQSSRRKPQWKTSGCLPARGETTSLCGTAALGAGSSRRNFSWKNSRCSSVLEMFVRLRKP